MTSMRERDIGAISRRLPDNLGVGIMSTLDLSHDLHKSCMYDQCKHKAFLQLFICFVHLTLGPGFKKSPI